MTKEELDVYMEEKGLRILCRPAFLYFLNHLKDYPGNYLEIGVFEGYSLRELAKEYPDKMIYGVDPFIEDGHTTGHNGVPKGERMWAQREATYRNINGIHNIAFFETESRNWGWNLPVGYIKEMNISCILVDGDHSYKECSNDLRLSLMCIPNGGVIWVDDQGLPSVIQAVEEFTKECNERISGIIEDRIFIR